MTVANTRPVTQVRPGYYYRDGQGVLLMDAELIPGTTDSWYLHRAGIAQREYLGDGTFITEWDNAFKRQREQRIESYNLVVEIDKLHEERNTPEQAPTEEERVQRAINEGRYE